MNRVVFSSLVIALSFSYLSANAHSSSFGLHVLAISRGGAAPPSKRKRKIAASSSNVFGLLASVVKYRLAVAEGELPPEESEVERALSALSSAQGTLKKFDGAAHEAYQRTHRSGESVDASVSGRARRSAARAGSAADALFAAELCELLETPSILDKEMTESTNGTLAGREIVVNATSLSTEGMNLTVLVLYEPLYHGGAGLNHGGIEDLLEESAIHAPPRGRLLVVVGDSLKHDLPRTLALLDEQPLLVGLHTGLVANEVVSVQGSLYRAAGKLLKEVLQPILQRYNSSETAVHFVGQSMAGGVASLAATILDGSVPLPEGGSSKLRKRKRRRSNLGEGDGTSQENVICQDSSSNTTSVALEGGGQGRSSAVVLGAPPCLSANVKAAFVTSIIYGDDVVCRTTSESLDRLCERTQKSMKGGFLGRQLSRMTDTVSLTVSSLKTHAHGSEGEEARLVVPGQVFLVRPRRLGGTSSMHEVGGLKGGREALRAAVLWQLHDILLSKSLWRHHLLGSYIVGLDRLQLRGLDQDGD